MPLGGCSRSLRRTARWTKIFLVSLGPRTHMICVLIACLVPTRDSKISKFNLEAYAVIEADATQSSFDPFHFHIFGF